jgi:hypothetical protein
MTNTENSTPKQRGRPFQKGQSGNPAGKPRGRRHSITIMAEQLLDGQAGALIAKATEMALAGDTTALRLCVERIVPPRKDRPVNFALPKLESANDAAAAMAAIAEAVATGELTPLEAKDIVSIIASFAKVRVESKETWVKTLTDEQLEAELHRVLGNLGYKVSRLEERTIYQNS